MTPKATHKQPKAARKRGERRRPRPRTLAVAGLVLASVVVAALIGEIAVRLIYGPKFRPRAVFGVGDAHLGWKPAPNLDDTFYGPDYAIQIRTDQDGYRLGEFGRVDYTKESIVLLGDSYAFGWGLSTDDTFASRLDALMSRESRGGLRLINLGVGGYGVLQSVDRFEEFLRAHPDAHVRIVVQQHCVNDAADNFRSLGYHLGEWEVEPVERPRSPSHLLNLIAYARMVSGKRVRTDEITQASNPDGADMLWSFQRRGAVVSVPEHTRIGGQDVRVDPKTYKENLSVDVSARRSTLAPAQREIMAGALNLLHAACVKRGITVVHTFIAGTPAWYVDEVSRIARASAAMNGCRVVATGIIPSRSGSADSIRNTHSGGHFNARFSSVWAEQMAAVLRDSTATRE